MAPRRRAGRSSGSRAGRTRKRRPVCGRNRGRRGSGRYPISGRSSEFMVPLCAPKTLDEVKFNTYIKRVLHKVKPRLNINRQSVKIMDNLMKDTLHQIATQASSKMGRRKVLKPKILMRALRKIMPRSLVEKADQRGQIALEKYMSHTKKRRGLRRFGGHRYY